MSGSSAAPLPQTHLTPGRRVRVCLCSFEIDGPSRGGIGTAYTSLAEALAVAGHDATLLLAADKCRYGGPPPDWEAHFSKHGIRFEMLRPLPFALGPVRGELARTAFVPRLPSPARARLATSSISPRSWVSPDDSLLARYQGLAFERTTLCVGAHGPSQWVREASGTRPLVPPLTAAILFRAGCCALAGVEPARTAACGGAALAAAA